MNPAQRSVLILAAFAVAAIVIFPPYQVITGYGTVAGRGFGLVFALPRRATVDMRLFAVELLGIGALAAIAYALTSSAGRSQTPRASTRAIAASGSAPAPEADHQALADAPRSKGDEDREKANMSWQGRQPDGADLNARKDEIADYAREHLEQQTATQSRPERIESRAGHPSARGQSKQRTPEMEQILELVSRNPLAGAAVLKVAGFDIEAKSNCSWAVTDPDGRRHDVHWQQVKDYALEQVSNLMATELSDALAQRMLDAAISASQSPLKKLASGRYGLAKTFWLYDVAASIAFNLMFELAGLTQQPALLMAAAVVMLAYLVYWPFALLGLWRAAEMYRGLPLWAWLARIWVALGWLGYVVGAIIVLGLLAPALQSG